MPFGGASDSKARAGTLRPQFSYMRFAVSVSATLWFLVTAREVIQPLLIALFVWFLLGALARRLTGILRPLGIRSPWAGKVLSAICVFGLLLTVGTMLAASVERFAAELPSYEARLDAMLASFADRLGMEASIGLGDTLSAIEIAPAALNALGSAANFLTAFIIVVVYIIFINKEVGAAERKLARLVSEPSQRERVMIVGERILEDIETYIAVKVFVGSVQAVPTYVVLSLLGVNAPIFWAVVIFVFSFIPTIGTMIGIVFPTLMALIQFETPTPFLTVLATLVPIQLFASNYLEPKLMGDRLNLSTLVVFIGIFAAGALWGVVGALVVVPLLAITVIVFSRIPAMRPVAILISADGEVVR